MLERRHPDLNWGIKVLQTSALPLGYGAVNLLIYYSRNTCVCQGLFTVFRKYFSSHYISRVLFADFGKQHPKLHFSAKPEFLSCDIIHTLPRGIFLQEIS